MGNLSELTTLKVSAKRREYEPKYEISEIPTYLSLPILNYNSINQCWKQVRSHHNSTIFNNCHKISEFT